MNQKNAALNFVWLLFDKLIKSFGNFFINLQVISYLSIKEYGTLNYALAINLFILALFTFYREILVKEFTIASSKTEITTIFGASILIRITSVILVLALLGIFPQGSTELNLIIASALINASDLPETFWQSRNQMQKPMILRVVTFSIFGSLKLYYLNQGFGFQEFCMLFLYESITTFLLSLIYFFIDFKIAKIHFSHLIKKTIELLKQSFPLFLNNLFTVAYMRIDQFFIKDKLGEGILGKYSFTLNIAEMLQSIPFMLSLALAPSIFLESDLVKLRRELFGLMKFMLISGLIAIILLLTLFPFVANHYNQKDTTLIMIIIAIGTYPNFISFLAGKYLIHTNQISHFLKRSFFASIFSLALNYLFIERFGLFACALIYAAAQWYIGILSNKSLSDNSIYKVQTQALRSIFRVSTYSEFVRSVITVSSTIKFRSK